MKVDITPELENLIQQISTKSMYYGNKIPDSVMRQFEVEVRDDGAGILAPFWLSVLQKGRGPRRGTKSYDLWKRIYAWMAAKNMFRSATDKGKVNEAKSLTWYINKYGNKHFRSNVFVDIYTSEREKAIEEINKKYELVLHTITYDIL